MKHVLLAVCALGVGMGIGFLVGRGLRYKSEYDEATIFTRADEAYLSDRFAEAYHDQPAPVAIWEGNSLLLLMAKNQGPVMSQGERAQETRIHARLCALYWEISNQAEANKQAQQTIEAFQRLVGSNAPSGLEVVTNLIARDRIQRQNAGHQH
jgi:hypothetical protein